jgi:hypothetical protein
MSLSEIFNDGSSHPWANLRINNLTIDNGLTLNGSATILVPGVSTTTINYVTTTSTSPTNYITFTAVANGTYLINIDATSYITSGSGAGGGAFNSLNEVVVFNGGSVPANGSLQYSPINQRVGAIYGTTYLLGPQISITGSTINLQVINGNTSANSTDFVILTTIIGPVT